MDVLSVFPIFLLLVFGGIIWLAIWIGGRAHEKGYSRAGFVVFGLFFSLIALIVVLVIQPTQTAQVKGLAKCPHCAEAIQPDAKVCKHCGRDVLILGVES